MIAGSLAVLAETVADPLESYYRHSANRALDVEATQQSFDGTNVQSGLAVDSIDATETRVDFIADGDEYVGVDVEREDTAETVATEWVADVQNTGVVAAESTADTGGLQPFPFELIGSQAGAEVTPVRLDVQSLYAEWVDTDRLEEIWLKGVEEEPEDDDDPGGVSFDYHARAETGGDHADVGVGFRLRWGGMVARGVAYSSGYVAVYNASTAGEFVEFAAEEILPHALEVEADEADDAQSTLDDVGGGA